MNLGRISFAYPINVKYDCLAFREDMLLTYSTMIDLYQSKKQFLKKKDFRNTNFPASYKSNKNITRFSWPFVGY